jgi:hypothetical protein
MASSAQAVTSSISGATNQSGADPGAVASASLPAPTASGAPSRPQDTVNLTETGGRNVAVGTGSGKPQAAFQVAYFPPSSAPGTKVAGAESAETQASGAAAATPAAVKPNNPTAQVANAAAAAAANSGGAAQANAGTGSGVTSSSSPSAPLSAASQAKLQKLDEVLQQLGINPAQISFADRIALLPLANDPAALQQYIQGLPTQTAVLNPATSQVLAPSLGSQPGATQIGANGAGSSASGAVANLAQATGATATGGTTPSNGSGATTIQSGTSAFGAAAGGLAPTPEATGQKVNISV